MKIIVGSRRPGFLDGECARYGAPAFDLACCLNHLLLKCLWTPAQRAAALQCLDPRYTYKLAESSFKVVDIRAATLLPSLPLARVDGKSPVEYLSESQRQLVRQFARPLVGSASSLAEIRNLWQRSST